LEVQPEKRSSSYHEVPLVRLTRDLLAKDRYDKRVRPISNHSKSLKIHLSMSLYQIIDVNWTDEMLTWDPQDYGMINMTILPHYAIWIPDTYLYNSVVMSHDETERFMNVKVSSRHWENTTGANISFLYPAINTLTCRLNVRYFPYDQQKCTLIISSWTNSIAALNYTAEGNVNMESFIRSEEWDVISFRIHRHERVFACCAEPWVMIEATLTIRRKALYYVINLIIPTSIITIVSITGFFTPATTSDDRTEKINLGITTLLAMSILMLMVSDQMPTTSDFVPLIAWFYLSVIIIISIGTMLTTVIINVQARRRFGVLPADIVRIVCFVYLAYWMFLAIPTQLVQLWDELNVSY
uniref:Acetylcholine receptor subunit alpha-type deg-3 (inferred by orthology to a C. elegans protein) n=2 Tax=Anisakis simplex TaxID=6269 RepID=A0A0M3KAL8_ANISI